MSRKEWWGWFFLGHQYARVLFNEDNPARKHWAITRVHHNGLIKVYKRERKEVDGETQFGPSIATWDDIEDYKHEYLTKKGNLWERFIRGDL